MLLQTTDKSSSKKYMQCSATLKILGCFWSSPRLDTALAPVTHKKNDIRIFKFMQQVKASSQIQSMFVLLSKTAVKAKSNVLHTFMG